jgi:diguanylate cyclase (GGDEF)-like protein
MQIHPAALARLLIPLTLVAVGLYARPRIAELDASTLVLLTSTPYLACGICVILALLFNRLRLLLAAAGLATLYWLLRTRLQVSLDNPDAARLFLVASLATPLGVMFLLLLPERRPLSNAGLMISACFIALIGGCFLLADLLQADSGPSAGYFAARGIDGLVLAQGSVLLFAVAALGCLLVLLLRDSETESALFGMLLASFLGLGLLHLPHISIAMASAASLCLAWGLVHGSHAMAYRDDLTGLLGRRALNERLNSLGRRYSIAMLDVDHFKRFNDTHGHDVGDEVLKLVASRVRQVGQGGTAYRYGGEEFCIVFPRKSPEDCARALDAVREEIAGYRLSIRDHKQRPVKTSEGSRRRGASRVGSKSVSVTVSAGVATRDEALNDPEKVLLAADSKLYKAKRAGRNRVVF